MARTYPAKKAAGNRKQRLPGTLAVEVRRHGGGHQATARKTSVTGHSAAWAAYKLAEKLGYSKHADVCYLRTEDGVQHFRIVEPRP